MSTYRYEYGCGSGRTEITLTLTNNNKFEMHIYNRWMGNDIVNCKLTVTGKYDSTDKILSCHKIIHEDFNGTTSEFNKDEYHRNSEDIRLIFNSEPQITKAEREKETFGGLCGIWNIISDVKLEIIDGVNNRLILNDIGAKLCYLTNDRELTLCNNDNYVILKPIKYGELGPSIYLVFNNYLGLSNTINQYLFDNLKCCVIPECIYVDGSYTCSDKPFENPKDFPDKPMLSSSADTRCLSLNNNAYPYYVTQVYNHQLTEDDINSFNKIAKRLYVGKSDMKIKMICEQGYTFMVATDLDHAKMYENHIPIICQTPRTQKSNNINFGYVSYLIKNDKKYIFSTQLSDELI